MIRYEPNGIGVVWSDSRGFIPVRLYTYDSLYVAEDDTEEEILRAFSEVVDNWRMNRYVLLAVWLEKRDGDSEEVSIVSFTTYDKDIRSIEFGGDKAEYDRILKTYKKGESNG